MNYYWNFGLYYCHSPRIRGFVNLFLLIGMKYFHFTIFRYPRVHPFQKIWCMTWAIFFVFWSFRGTVRPKLSKFRSYWLSIETTEKMLYQKPSPRRKLDFAIGLLKMNVGFCLFQNNWLSNWNGMSMESYISVDSIHKAIL